MSALGRFIVAIAIPAALLATGVVSAPVQEHDDVRWIDFAEIFGSLHVPERWASRSESSRKIAGRISAAAAELNEKWIQDSGAQAPVPRVYFNSLKADVDALKRVGSLERYSAADDDLLRDVARDLELKVIHCNLSSKGWADTVETRVSTMKATAKVPVHSLEVWYAPRGWATDKSHWLRFPRLSTPTEAKLAPGIYMVRYKGGTDQPMWVGEGGKKLTEFELVVE
jgi:hypothetical protein